MNALFSLLCVSLCHISCYHFQKKDLLLQTLQTLNRPSMENIKVTEMSATLRIIDIGIDIDMDVDINVE